MKGKKRMKEVEPQTADRTQSHKTCNTPNTQTSTDGKEAGMLSPVDQKVTV